MGIIIITFLNIDLKNEGNYGSNVSCQGSQETTQKSSLVNSTSNNNNYYYEDYKDYEDSEKIPISSWKTAVSKEFIWLVLEVTFIKY